MLERLTKNRSRGALTRSSAGQGLLMTLAAVLALCRRVAEPRVNFAPPTTRPRIIRPFRPCCIWAAWSPSGPAAGHQIRVFHSRQLGEEVETIARPRAGVLDLNRTNVAPISAIVPVLNVLQMPFLFRSGDHLHKVLDGPIGQEILASLEAARICRADVLRFRRALDLQQRPADPDARRLKGMRDPLQQSELMVDMIKALGAQPVEFSYGQVGTALTPN